MILIIKSISGHREIIDKITPIKNPYPINLLFSSQSSSEAKILHIIAEMEKAPA
ncbi:hypothetical protein LCGC14_0741390 [marine sediment metagenome]|uniref:Uncharacterized protein n=1 Tax=marine sediment metagenome TaxID=412755 RepID=A0A0F9QAV1_9ZZZZ